MSLYIPKYAEVTDAHAIFTFLEENSLAALTTITDNTPQTSYLPMIVQKDAQGKLRLRGHLARANPHAREFLESPRVWCDFLGPHGYISPQWYENPLNVPTWNYTLVRIEGELRPQKNEEELEQILQESVAHWEHHFEKKWQYQLPADFQQGLLKKILGFEIVVDKVEAKFKLGQNRDQKDRASLIRGVEVAYQQKQPQLVTYMKRALETNLPKI